MRIVPGVKRGVFATRSPHRPNPIGMSVVKLEKIDLHAKAGIEIHVSGVDLLNGTPVLDIKPWVQEFGPRGEVRQANWISELMRDYWKSV